MNERRVAMNETEWNNWTDPGTMLDYIRGPESSMNRPVVATHRQLILWACACCRRIAHLFHDTRCLSAVLAAEGFADGELTYKELRAIGASTSKWPETYYKSGEESVTAFVAQSCMHLVEGVDSAFDGMETGFLPPAERRDTICHRSHSGKCWGARGCPREEHAMLDSAGCPRQSVSSLPLPRRLAHTGRESTCQ